MEDDAVRWKDMDKGEAEEKGKKGDEEKEKAKEEEEKEGEEEVEEYEAEEEEEEECKEGGKVGGTVGAGAVRDSDSSLLYEHLSKRNANQNNEDSSSLKQLDAATLARMTQSNQATQVDEDDIG